MPEQVNSENNEVVTPEVGDVHDDTQQTPPGHTLAIQNNYFSQQVDITQLRVLRQEDPELATMYMDIVRDQFEHGKEMDIRIVTMEEKEQDGRLADQPNKKTYAFRAQIGSFSIVVGAFLTAIAFGFLGMEKAAIAAIVTGAGVIAVNFLGVRNKGQK